MQPFNMFFKRVLHLAAQRVLDLTDALTIPEDVKEKVWTITKAQLSTEPQLLLNRHLDQLMMCTIYGVCKVQGSTSSITFNNIITKYADMFKNQKQISQMYIQVVIDQEKGDKKDIIHFYNEVYIKVMKDYIISTKPQVPDPNIPLGSRTPIITSQGTLTPGIHKAQIKALCPPSPLR
jgi:retinoblastoma-like protein 1